MSILIKGMEMPESCENCPLLDWDLSYIKCKATGRHFKVKEEAFRAQRVDDCPLVEIPPHGRLIDADALRLLYDFNGYKPTGDMTEEEFDRLMCRLPIIRANIDDAPTVIEAEEKS